MNDVIVMYVSRATCKLGRTQCVDRVSNLRLEQDVPILNRAATVLNYIYFIVNNCNSRHLEADELEK